MASSTNVDTPSTKQSIPRFFAGRSIFITGGTGFIGKVLIEKLLRSCPDIGTIYLLMRPKRGKSTQERIQDIGNLQLFDKLKEKEPSALNKLVGIPGDILELELGMSTEDRRLIQNEVSIVFHIAATVRFDEPLTKAVLANVRGTREVVKLATGMKQLKVLLHTSTAYTNTPHKTIEERIYDSPMNWETIIEAAETSEPTVFRVLTNKIVGNRPNTYTFTKALGECVINDYQNQLPVVIYRPSIVGPTWSEPIDGWLENFYGPTGLLVGVGKGIVHTAYHDENVMSDVIPVDAVCKGMIIATSVEGQQRTESLPVYNSSFSGTSDFRIGFLSEKGITVVDEIPYNNALYRPFVNVTTHFSVFYMQFLLLQLIPALFIDALLKLSGKKTMLTRLQRRIYYAVNLLHYFLFNGWNIKTEKFRGLETSLAKEDCTEFRYNFSENVDLYKWFKSCVYGGRRYLLKEGDETLPAARLHAGRLYMLHVFLRILLYSSIFWVDYSYSVTQKLISAVFYVIRVLLIL